MALEYIPIIFYFLFLIYYPLNHLGVDFRPVTSNMPILRQEKRAVVLIFMYVYRNFR